MLTLNEAASVLGIAPSTLRHQIRNGRLTAMKIGRDWLVTADEIERYRRDSRGQPGRPATQTTDPAS